MSHIISSYLLDKPERTEAKKLNANEMFSFIGSGLRGAGFVLSMEERGDLVARDRCNAEKTPPFIGGQEVNTSPNQMYDRYVIDFGTCPLEEASAWPDLLEIVRERVKPTRDRARNHGPGLHGKKYWWQHALRSDALYEAIAPLQRCLVTARVTKHLCFSFQPTDRVYNEKLYVFPLSADAHFAILQSRVHEPWVRLHSSTLGETLNYSASDCFETFPFPDPDPRTIMPCVEAAGQELYEARSEYMISANQGLTKTYNALKDPQCTDAQIVELRRLHEAMDRAVLDAYGWNDIQVPEYQEKNEAFENEIIDRLYSLNKLRHDEKINSA